MIVNIAYYKGSFSSKETSRNSFSSNISSNKDENDFYTFIVSKKNYALENDVELFLNMNNNNLNSGNILINNQTNENSVIKSKKSYSDKKKDFMEIEYKKNEHEMTQSTKINNLNMGSFGVQTRSKSQIFTKTKNKKY